MNTIYLIVSMAVSLNCPSQWGSDIILTYASPTQVGAPTVTNAINPIPCSCSKDMSVVFLLEKGKAQAALEGGARVWKISFLPPRISELKRNALTTYSIVEEPVR